MSLSGSVGINVLNVLLIEQESSSGGASSRVISALDPQIAHAKGLRGIVHTTVHAESPTIASRTQTIVVSSNSVVLRIDVSDTGIGIARDQFDTLFNPFSQVDGTSTRKFGGTGLGLSIVKGLVQLMGGKVLVESTLGHGSTFSLLIPVMKHADPVVPYQMSLDALRQEQEDIRLQKELPLRNYHILVVDDVVVNRVVLETKLREMGAKIQSAPNGRIAVELALEAEKEKSPFDFVLMDLQMPIMDGFEATRTLRQRGFAKPIVALTANRDSNEQAIASGCNQVLLKPADRSMLLNTITGLVPK